MYPQQIEEKTLGRFEINPHQVRKHLIEKGELKEDQFGQVVFEPDFYTQLPSNNFVAHTIEIVPKYVSCGSCGKYLSFTEVDYVSIKRMGESARVLYVEDAEKQRKLDDEFNNETLVSDQPEMIKKALLKHIRSDNEIKIDSYVYMYKYIASVLDGIDENNKDLRETREAVGHTKICSTCENGTWWTQIP